MFRHQELRVSRLSTFILKIYPLIRKRNQLKEFIEDVPKTHRSCFNRKTIQDIVCNWLYIKKKQINNKLHRFLYVIDYQCITINQISMPDGRDVRHTTCDKITLRQVVIQVFKNIRISDVWFQFKRFFQIEKEEDGFSKTEFRRFKQLLESNVQKANNIRIKQHLRYIYKFYHKRWFTVPK